MNAEPIAPPRIPLAEGQRIAAEVLALLDGAYDRALVVGSVRRKAEDVHDVEILITPRYETRTSDLFGGTSTFNALEGRCAALLEQGVLSHVTPRCWGARLKRFWLDGVKTELFICIEPSQWGLAAVIRTGPRDFSHQVVTPKGQRCAGTGRLGLLPPDLVVHDQGIYRGVKLIETPTEEDVFEIIGRPYVEPEDRR